MGFPNVDPNAVREQQQLQRMQALEQSKRASPISGKKMLLILVPVLAVALVLVLFFSGVFSKAYTIRWNGGIYRISDAISEDLVYELPEGYVLAGSLVFAENPKRSGEDLSSDWTLEAELYTDPDNDRVVYITAYKGYLKARKQ